MLIPLASPIGLGETRVMELTPETWQEVKDQDVYYREGLDGIIRLYVPVTAILSPVYPVMAMKRSLYCDKCQEVKTHKLEVRHGWTYYVCDCGSETTYFVVTRSGKL